MNFILCADLLPIVAPAVVFFDRVRVLERDERMDAPMAGTAARLQAPDALAAEIAQVRAMYKRVGLDPTKTRPSSEALLRRVRKGDPLPRINSLVDIGNWCSVETQLPYGLYDLDRIEGHTIYLRTGAEGEGYDGIRKDRVNVDGRMTLADKRGPFGNPTSDSARTMVTLETQRVLFVIYAPRDYPRASCERAVELTSRRVHDYGSAADAPVQTRVLFL